MTNPYYNRVVSDFLPDTAVRSGDLDAELNAIVAAFEKLSDPTKISNGGSLWGAETGTADNYVYNNGASATLVDGQIITFNPGNTNTDASVVAVNGGANKNIVRNDGTALQAGDLVAGIPTMMIYDPDGDRWVLIGVANSQILSAYRPSISAQTGTSYTITATDENSIITFSNASAVSVTAPSDSTEDLPLGFIVHLHQTGAGQVSVVADTGVTIQYAYSLDARAQYSSLSLMKIAANTYVLVGDIG